MTLAPARTLASAGTAGAGALTGAAAYLIVGGLPGVLYAAGICLAALVGTTAIRASRRVSVLDLVAAPLVAGRRRGARDGFGPEPAASPETVPVAHPEAVASGSELHEHRMALANLGAQLTRESEAARRDMQRLENRIRELEAERDGLLELVSQERVRFELAIAAFCEGIDGELDELEPALQAVFEG